MNKERRAKIEKCMNRMDKCLEELRDIETILYGIQDEEQDAFDNLPEGIQASERGSVMEENIDTLSDATDEICDSITTLQEIIDQLMGI